MRWIIIAVALFSLTGCATQRYVITPVEFSHGIDGAKSFKAVMLVDSHDGQAWMLYGAGPRPHWTPVMFDKDPSGVRRFADKFRKGVSSEPDAPEKEEAVQNKPSEATP